MSIARLYQAIPGLEDVPLIGILRQIPMAQLLPIAKGAADAGLKVAEVTLDSIDAFDQVEVLVEADLGLTVGVGSVRSSHEVEAAAGAGASFVVSPVVDHSVIDECANHDIPCLPGAATPTEIHAALAAGAIAVKVFPAEQLGGPAFIRAVRSPLRSPALVPTGGVTLEKARGYMEAGAAALGVGGAMFGSGDPSTTAGEVSKRVGLWIEQVLR